MADSIGNRQSAIGNGDPVPAGYLPLLEICRRGSRKPNVVRKHFVDSWARGNRAVKGPKGRWYVDPAVLESMKPGTPIRADRTPEGRPGGPECPRAAQASAPRRAGRSRQDAARAAEKRVQQAIEELLKADEIDWDPVTELGAIGRRLREEARK